MADQRGMGFPPGNQQGVPGNFQMMPGTAQFPMMQQGFPMPQGNAMMQQQMMMQGGQFQTPMFNAQNQFVQPGMQYGVPMPRGPQGFAPPPYTPQMAQDFKQKQECECQLPTTCMCTVEPATRDCPKCQQKVVSQKRKFAAQQAKMIEEQRKKMEAAMKEQQFKEQQKKLREFSAIGGRKMDADSLINSIIGPKPASGPRPGQQGGGHVGGQPGHQMTPVGQPGLQQPLVQPPQPQEASMAEEDDGFGDFMMGPSAPTPSETGMQPAGQQQAPPPTQPPQTQEEKKDLMSYMMQCSDLNAPAKARAFTKPSVSEVQPKRVRAAAYQQSQKARQWKQAEEEDLSGVFILPTPQPPPPQPAPQQQQQQQQQQPQPQPMPTNQDTGGGHGHHVPDESGAGGYPAWLPKWLTGEVPPPKIYLLVEEAATRDGKLDTELIYPILLRSGLPRDVLGRIWAMANRRTPGQLTPTELYMVLALITIAQNNMDYSSLEVLARCIQAPIPNLGQNKTNGSLTDGKTPAQPEPAAMPDQPAHTAPGLHTPVPAPVLSPGSEEGFADFQSAPPPKSDSFGDFTSPQTPQAPGFPQVQSLNTSGPPVPAPSMPAAPAPAPLLLGDEDRYSHLRTISESSSTGIGADDLEFDDFKSATVAAGAASSQGFASFDDVPIPQATVGAGFPPTNIQKPSLAADDDFADFQSVPVSAAKPDPSAEKIAALKALISDTKLYEPPPKKAEDNIEMKGCMDGLDEEEDWADFHQASASEAAPANNLMENGLSGSSMGWIAPNDASSSIAAKLTNQEVGEEGWASFSLPDQQMDWASSEPAKEVTLNWGAADTEQVVPSMQKPISTRSEPSIDKTFKEPLRPVSKGRRYDLFGQHIEPKIPAGTGMSPLDILPPDMPDDDEEEDFDKFGTFQQGETGGGSTLPTAYGGLDDDLPGGSVDMFGYSSQPRASSREKDTGDTVSTSSSEFTGWKAPGANTKEDTQSISSLDLNSKIRNSKDTSPVGGDSQSVSSLEFGAMDIRKVGTPGDDKSIASLELKVASTPDEGPLGPRMEEDSFGEFSSATDSKQGFAQTPTEPLEYIQKPRTASDLMATGDLPRIGDRYSGLTGEVEDEDRHATCWLECLEKCNGMIHHANNTMAEISSPDVCQEVIKSEQGRLYLEGIVEVYRIACKVTAAMKALSASNQKLLSVLKDIDLTWNNLTSFLTGTAIMPSQASLDFRPAALKPDMDDAQQKACGVCLLDINTKPRAKDYEMHTLTYGGRQYHSVCANFWVNCVDSTLPALKIPELL